MYVLYLFLWLGRFWLVVSLECLVEGAFYDEARTLLDGSGNVGLSKSLLFTELILFHMYTLF